MKKKITGVLLGLFLSLGLAYPTCSYTTSCGYSYMSVCLDYYTSGAGYDFIGIFQWWDDFTWADEFYCSEDSVGETGEDMNEPYWEEESELDNP